MRATVALAALLALLALAGPAGASVVVQLADADLTAGAEVIVRGRIVRITSHADASGEISTYITLTLDEILKGAVWGSEITIRELGGTVGDRHTWASANPQFVLGEPVLLFMDQRDDGTLRTYQFYMGKFTIVSDPGSGDQVALRAVPPQVTVLGSADAPAIRVPAGDVARGLDDFGRFIREHAFDPAPPMVRPRPVLPLVSAAVPSTGVFEDHQEFRFIVDPDPPAAVNPSLLTPRWTQADTNTPVTVRIFSNGEPLAPSLGFDQIRAAFKAWSRVPTSAFRYVEGAPISGTGGHVTDGISTVSFRDPLGQISNPSGCSGILAMAWTSWTSQGQTTVNGRTFGKMTETDVVTADGWTGCGFYENFSNFTETLTHELGHGLGLGHSADNSADFVNLGGRTGATMNAFVHFDGRVNGLHADDRAGVTFIYPGRTLSVQVTGNGTVTSGTDGIACPGECVAGFALNSTVALTAAPGPGSAFSGFSGSDCGASVVMSADRACTATFTSGTPGTFQDVLTTHPFYQWIETVAGAGIAAGCSTTPSLFCPGDVITRSTMAGWLLRGIHGASYQPPAATGFFADVSVLDPAAPWIEELFHEAITSGCGQNPAVYCPGQGVTRGQMAVFLLRAKYGASYVPPPASGIFTDVPVSHPFVRYIEQLANEGITSGCGPTTYCPDATITRGQMAVFAARAFNL